MSNWKKKLFASQRTLQLIKFLLSCKNEEKVKQKKQQVCCKEENRNCFIISHQLYIAYLWSSRFFKSQLVVFCKHNQTDSKKLCRWRPPAAQTLDSAWAVNGNESIFCPADPLLSTQWGDVTHFCFIYTKK